VSTDYRIEFEKDTTIDELLSSTDLIELESKHADDQSMFVSMECLDGEGVWFHFDNRIITGFTRYGANYEAADDIADTIRNTLGVAVISEHEDDYYTAEDRFWFMCENLVEFFKDYFEVRKQAQEIHDHCMNARFLLEEGVQLNGHFESEWNDTDVARCGSYQSVEDNETYFFELLNPGE
jgi:hypothetical protein